MEDAPRYTIVFSSTTIPRHSIQSLHHEHIDVSLKELRIVSRRLLAFSSPFSDELHILERIYYKGKNQHRSALFWQKVVEMRRLGARIKDLDIRGLVEGLRCSFHASDNTNNSKALRGAWNYTPDAQACKAILRRSRAAYFLIDQARGRFRVAHQSFTQQLRTATFLPLAVSLIAITSRLDFLLVELGSIISLHWGAVVRILKAIDVTSDLKPDFNLLFPFPSLSKQEHCITRSERPRKKSKLSVGKRGTEDLGSKAVRDFESHRATSTPLDLLKGARIEPAVEAVQCSEVTVDSALVLDSETHWVREYNAPHIIDARAMPRGPSPSSAQPLASAASCAGESLKANLQQKKRMLAGGKKTKKAKAKDEIDDIFGF